jgi:acetylornithine deacetylase/succinyl-diaminopimelate desuccinylase-like protein
MNAIDAWLAAEREAILDQLKAFVRIPSVSTDPAYKDHVANAAIFVAKQLAGAGLVDAKVRPTEGNPVVTASWRGAPGKPTVLIYGHFDVQPPDPLESWTTEPFEPTIRDHRLYARGASDDKGPMLIPIKVVEAFLACDRALPVNVVFLFEGEEEVSSAHLEAFVAAHREELAADFALSADGAQWRADLPSVITGSRGICALEVIVKSADKDLHSGRHGGAVANPIQVLARILASLHDADGRVAVPGFYDTVVELPKGELDDIARLPWSEADYLRSIGASEGVGEAGYTLLQRNWVRPTLEFNGIFGGYTGPGKKTVIPAFAQAKITCRLVPHQEPALIAELISRHLTSLSPPGAAVSVKIETGGATPYAVPCNHPGLRLAETVLAEIIGTSPIRVRMGATIPIGAIFKRVLGLDTVFFSFATSDEDYHAPNEFFRLASLDAGLRAWRIYLTRLGSSTTLDLSE